LNWLLLLFEYKGKGSPYSIAERRVPELIPVFGSPVMSVINPDDRLPLLSDRPTVTLTTLKRVATNFVAHTIGVNSLPKTVTRQRRGCNLNPSPSSSESSMLTTRLLSHLSIWTCSNVSVL